MKDYKTVNGEWNNMKTVIKEKLEEYVGRQDNRNRKVWITEEMMEKWKVIHYTNNEVLKAIAFLNIIFL